MPFWDGGTDGQVFFNEENRQRDTLYCLNFSITSFQGSSCMVFRALTDHRQSDSACWKNMKFLVKDTNLKHTWKPPPQYRDGGSFVLPAI